MSIWGNVVGGNKPLEAVAAAQKAADDAAKVAGNALPKAGGTMTGDIAMGNKKITGLGDPTNSSDGANKGYVDSKHLEKTATLTVNDWEGDKAPYTQTIGIAGILETDKPHVFPVYSENMETRKAQKKAWANVSDGDAGNGTITFTCDDSKPAISIPVQIEVNR